MRSRVTLHICHFSQYFLLYHATANLAYRYVCLFSSLTVAVTDFSRCFREARQASSLHQRRRVEMQFVKVRYICIIQRAAGIHLRECTSDNALNLWSFLPRQERVDMGRERKGNFSTSPRFLAEEFVIRWLPPRGGSRRSTSLGRRRGRRSCFREAHDAFA